MLPLIRLVKMYMSKYGTFPKLLVKERQSVYIVVTCAHTASKMHIQGHPEILEQSLPLGEDWELE